MDEIALLGGLHEVIDKEIDKQIKEWIDKHNVNYYLLYPLAMIEIGAMEKRPEHIDNLFKRCIAAYIYEKINLNKKELYLKKFYASGLKKYIKEYEKVLYPLYQNYRFSREINDINPVSKAKLECVGDHKYKLTTCLVTNKYREEDFYFYGEDDNEQRERELHQVLELHHKFYEKIIIQQRLPQELEENIDSDLYRECVRVVEKDICKWNSNVRSKVFDNPKQISKIIAYFYYYAMVRTMFVQIFYPDKETKIENADQCIMRFEKEKCIEEISQISNMSSEKVKKIVEYFINTGLPNFLEFPLFELDNKLITIPSLILVNDWQFTIINGHYLKDITINNRKKTISETTENKLYNLLKNIKNVVVAKQVPYSFKDEEGKTNNSDVDFAVWDKKTNTVLVIEAKWIDRHYKDEIDKRYGEILRTFNSIYNNQISKHKKFLSRIENINYLFNYSTDEVVQFETMPTIFYLAVDKRNQMHIEEKHMITEYMMMYFIKENIHDGELDILTFWNEISNLRTKFEYIQCSNEFYEISVGDDTILVEKADLKWKD